LVSNCTAPDGTECERAYFSRDRRIVQRSTLVTLSIPFPRPRVLREPSAQRFLGRRVHDVEGLSTAFHRATKNDDAVVDERVHELCVLRPQLLLAHVPRPIPWPAALDADEEQLAMVRHVLHHTIPVIVSRK
jgi:hypothetical protein